MDRKQAWETIQSIKDDAEKRSDKIGEADGLIIGSPIYASNVLTKLLKYSGAKLSRKLIYNLPFNENPNHVK